MRMNIDIQIPRGHVLQIHLYGEPTAIEYVDATHVLTNDKGFVVVFYGHPDIRTNVARYFVTNVFKISVLERPE